MAKYHTTITVVSTLFVACVIMMASWGGARWWESNRPVPVAYLSPPFITDVHGNKLASFPPGRSVVLHVHGLRQPYDCWGQYITYVNGPVSWTFHPQYSQIYTDKATEFTLRVMLELPQDLPDGEYTWHRLFMPTCDGIQLRPLKMDMYGLTMKISKGAVRDN